MGGNREPESSRRLIRYGAVVYGADDDIARWVGKAIPGYFPTPGAKALGVIKNKQLVAGVIYERFNGSHVEATIAAKPGSGWADRRTLFALFHYPFIQLGCLAITVVVPVSNLASLNLATKLGFEPQAMVRFAAHDGSTLIVLQQYRDTCRWIKAHGQGQQSTIDAGPLQDGSSGSAIQPA